MSPKGKNSIFGIATGVALSQGLPGFVHKLRKWSFRFRRVLTPVWTGAFVWLVAVVWHAQIPAWWPLVLVLPLLGAGLAWGGPHLSERWSRVVMRLVPDGLDKGKDGVLDRPVERAYLCALLSYAGLYLAVRIGWGPSAFSGWLWTAGLGIFGTTYWYHRRIRVLGKANKYVKKWARFADRDTCPPRLVSLIGSKVVRADVSPSGLVVSLVIKLPEGQTVDGISHLDEPLDSYFNLRKGATTVTEYGSKARYALVKFVPKDPWEDKIPHPLPGPDEVSLSGTGGQFPMGLYAHDESLVYRLQHTLLCGTNGCIAAGTRIYLPEENRHVPVEELVQAGKPITVLARTDTGFAHAKTDGAPYVKGFAKIYEVRCSDGASIRVTGQHRFLTPGGWRRLDDVRAGQLLAAAPRVRPPTTSVADRSASCEGAARSNNSEWTTVESITPVGEEIYYDLSVPGPENYVAEGLVNHNSGKSGWVHSLLAWLVPCRDVVLLGIDMASGATLNVWKKMFALPIATNVDAALIILEKVFAVIKNREAALGKAAEEDDEADDSFEPTKKTPWIVLIIDEFPDLLAEAESTPRIKDGKEDGNLLRVIVLLLGRIAKKARKCGIRLIFCTQNGTKVDVGSKEMQAQLKAIVGLRLDQQQSRNLWGPLERQGWRSTDLGLGEFLLNDEEHSIPNKAKGYWVTPEDRRRVVSANTGGTGTREVYLEPDSWALLMAETTSRDVEEELADPGPTEAELRWARIVEYLEDHFAGHRNGVRAQSLVEELKVPQSTLYRDLDRLKALGRAQSLKGWWYPAGKAPTESGPGPVLASIQGEQQDG